MCSAMSYYLMASALQGLEDYNNDQVVNDNDPVHNDPVVNGNDKVDNDEVDNYNLYIYVHDSDFDLKQMYMESSKKHNASVTSYLNYNLLTQKEKEKEVGENKFVNCYDSGFDLFCPENIEWQNISTYMLDHKISCAMTYKGKFVGYYLYMRSSTPVKTPLRLANNVGIIDSGYRGNIKAYFDIHGSNFNFVKGHRYMQICPPDIGKPMKVVIVDTMSALGENNARNKGGYGSTGD